MLSPRLMRRNLGFLSNYFSHFAALGQPADGRSKQGRRWKKVAFCCKRHCWLRQWLQSGLIIERLDGIDVRWVAQAIWHS
ncbi:MAG: hypothetical protein R3C68_10860 [Myxococcota bacterium]